MTEHCSSAITADALTGMIFALEGIHGTIVLLNGPMGCRFYHSTTSQFLSIHPLLYLPSLSGEKVPVDYNYLNNFFFRQQRVPCTWLDGYDYVYGTLEKVREGICYIKDHISFDLLAIVNAPGASLIGDMLEETAADLLPPERFMVLESPGLSTGYANGCSDAQLQLLRTRLGESGKKKRSGPCVNVFGLTIWNRYFEGDRQEIERLLNLCGIRVNCFVCGDCTLSQIDALGEADCNLVLDAEIGLESARLLERMFGTPYYCCDALPIGFDETQRMCAALCEMLGTDASPVFEEIARSRAYAWYKINGIYQSCGQPKGVRFAVEGSSAQVRGYTRFLTSYLGMRPSAPSECELYFADANQIAALMATGHVFCGIEISLPGMGYTDLVKKTHLGIAGSMFLTEQVLSGLMSRL